MFQQLLTPVFGSLLPSFVVALLPIATALIFLGVLRRPAWQASLAGLFVGIIVSVGPWHFPPGLALNAIANGATFALWPVMWIVFNALLLYNITVASGRFAAFRDWIINYLPDDRRVVLVVIGFASARYSKVSPASGTPVAITSALLILVGFPALDALVYTLIFNTAPVAFAALGVPITVLGAVTHLAPQSLAAMVGRQLPFFSLLLPFYVVALYGGIRSLRALWPVLSVAGGSFAFMQFVCSNFLNYALTDVLSSLWSLASTLMFLQRWSPVRDPQFAIRDRDVIRRGASNVTLWQAWLPWIIVSLTVILWTTTAASKIGEAQVRWPGLHDAVSITLYKSMPYAAIWDFQPLATGTAILFATIVISAAIGLPRAAFFRCAGDTWRQVRMALLTVTSVVGLAYLMNYSGLNYTLGLGVSSIGPSFVFLSPFLGWVSVLLSGSDTSGNALFGNLQVVAANQLKLDPILMAATNSSGGVMGKMISPQNLVTGAAVTDLRGREGAIFARTFPHSIALTLLLGGLVAIEQYLLPEMIPH